MGLFVTWTYLPFQGKTDTDDNGLVYLEVQQPDISKLWGGRMGGGFINYVEGNPRAPYHLACRADEINAAFGLSSIRQRLRETFPQSATTEFVENYMEAALSHLS